MSKVVISIALVGLVAGGTATVVLYSSNLRMEIRAAPDPGAVDDEPPDPGQFRVHLVDVDTGLGMLIQGSDFNLIYDGGSRDNRAQGRKNRLLAYLWQAIGPSGDEDCRPVEDGVGAAPGTQLTIQNLVLSHPHQDHAVLLPDVLRCYDVEVVWDSGAINDTKMYREFLQAVAAEPGVIYRTALAPPADRTVTVNGASITMATWEQFAEGGPPITLGTNATMRILHADGAAHSDPNENSIVLRLDLGQTSMLLMGDGESGQRMEPAQADGVTTNPLGDIEEHLVTTYPTEIDVDILQVGHHGSETSSLLGFLKAVSPDVALLSSGGFKYGSKVLPDQSVVDMLESEEDRIVLRTDQLDAHTPGVDESDRCGSDTNKIGDDNDTKDGGCNSWIIDLDDGVEEPCCRTCTKKACGDGCIAATSTCWKPPGCACGPT